MEVYDILVILNKNPSKSGPRKLLQGHAHALYGQNSNFWQEGRTDSIFFTKLTAIEFWKDFPQSEVILL